jgi:hypothetical protein
MASSSASHAHLFGIGIDYDITTAQYIVGGATFALALLVKMPGSKLLSLNLVIVLPLLCAASFGWAELLSEFDPSASHGWGIVWFVYSYVSSLGSAFVATLAKLPLVYQGRAQV